MINIISRSLVSDNVSGPKKVVTSLIKGLDIIGYPYVINKRLDACSQLWIHDDVRALAELKYLPNEIKTLIGPNLFIRPRNIPFDLDISRSVFLCPSKWAADFWTDFDFNKCPVDVWPAGIDTGTYKQSESEKEIVLIYFKQRLPEELQKIQSLLEQKNIKYKIVSYGSYRENDYKKLLEKSRYVIWLGRHETQGIALQEALATNTPMIVWEVKNLGHWAPNEKEKLLFDEKDNAFEKARVAEYFDERCGIKTNNIDKISETIDYMEKNWMSFNPREYVIENLSLEKQARDFIDLYTKHFGFTYDDGFNEKISKKGNWINGSFTYMIYFKIKKLAKKILTNN